MAGETISFGTSYGMGSGSPPTAISGVQKIMSGGRDITQIEVKALDDATRTIRYLSGRVKPKPFTLTYQYTKTNYAAFLALQGVAAEQNCLITYADGSTYAGKGNVASLSDPEVDEDDELKFTVDVQPSGAWTFTAGS